MLSPFIRRVPHGFFSPRLLSTASPLPLHPPSFHSSPPLPSHSSTSSASSSSSSSSTSSSSPPPVSEEFLRRMKFYSSHHQSDQVLQQFIELRTRHVRPSAQMFPLLLDACEQSRDPDLAVALFRHMEGWRARKKNFGEGQGPLEVPSLVLRETRRKLVRILCTEGDFHSALRYLEGFERAGEEIGVEFLNPIMNAIAVRDRGEKKSAALKFYEEMKRRGVKPNTETFSHLFVSQQGVMTTEVFEFLRADIETFGVEITLDLQAQIAVAQAKIGHFKQALQTLEQIVNQQKDNISLRGLTSLETLVNLCRSTGELRMTAALVEFLVELRGNPVIFGIERYTALAKICRRVIKKEHQLKADLKIPAQSWKNLIEDIVTSPLQPTLDCYSSILALQVQLSLVEEGRIRKESLLALKDAEQLLSKMRFEGFNPSLYVYNILIHGYSSLSYDDLQENERLTRALKVMEAMKGVDIKPNAHTYTSLFNACLPPKSWSTEIDMRIVDIEKQMRASGISHDVVSSGTFTRVLGAGRRFDEMFEAFYKMRREGVPRDISLYNSLLHSGKENPGSSTRAMGAFFDDSRNFPEIKPDFLTIRWLLGCCVSTKKVRLAEWIISTYAKDVGVQVDATHLASLLTVMIKAEEPVERLFHIVNVTFPENGVRLNRTALKIMLSHFCLTKPDMERAHQVIGLFEKKGKMKLDSMSVDLLIRGYLLTGGDEKALELFRNPLCEKKTFQNVLLDFDSQKGADNYRRARQIFNLLQEKYGKRWGEEPWYKKFEKQYAM